MSPVNLKAVETEPASQSVSLQKVSDAKIFKAVRHCIDQFGASKFTMTQVAAAAGLTRVQLYNRFGSRSALVLCLLVDHAAGFKARTARKLMKSRDLANAVATSLLAGVREIEKDPYFRMLIMPAVTGQNHTRETAAAILSLGKSQWMPALRRGQDDGIFRAELAIDETAEWLTFCEITLLHAVQTYDKTLKQCEAYIRDFILPSLISPSERP